MQAFKTHWEIQYNWQLIFPFLGLVGLFYSSYKLVNLFIQNMSIIWIILATILLFFLLLKCTLFIFKKLESKWELTYKWEMIRVFIVFAVTGSSSLIIGRPIMLFLGITKENLNPVFYWILFTIIGLVFYQLLLVFYGWIFGQFQFFWSFEKKMLRRFGIKI